VSEFCILKAHNEVLVHSRSLKVFCHLYENWELIHFLVINYNLDWIILIEYMVIPVLGMIEGLMVKNDKSQENVNNY